jgi:oxygen-dependent protoporphyrinogen oxidase
MVFREADLAGTDLRGIMIPRREKRPIDALTIARSPHPRVPAGYVIVKAFFGGGDSRTAELDEAAIGRVVRDELRRLLNIDAEPVAQRVYCWLNGFPQAAVGHLDLVDKAAQSLPDGLFLAGAAYRGIGVPDCIRQAQDAASKLTDFFAAGAR